MKSPIKDTKYKNLSVSHVKKIIPKGESLNTFGIFSGDLEISLSLYDINVNAHTNKPIIYQFWRCLFDNKERLCSILTDKAFKFRGVTEFNLIQDRLPMYKDSYLRSSMFFMLNRCSETGQVSCGKFNTDGYNALSLKYLRAFSKPDKFNVHFYENSDDKIEDSNFVLFHSLEFSYNLTNIGSSESYDRYNFNNKKLKNFLSNEKQKKVILIYNNHPGLHQFYKNFNLILINKYGLLTNNKHNCEEVIVTNF